MFKSAPRLNFNEIIDRLVRNRPPYHGKYLALYSSWYGGITTDPALMMVPIDDHLVHRGDGVFEAFKCRRGQLYALQRHLDRFESSAHGSFLASPMSRARLVETILETVRAGGEADCLVRLFLSRGPGGFSANPYECPESQLYVVVTRLGEIPGDKYRLGVTLRTSAIPMKQGVFANLKSCNYLPNVLMTKEARDLSVDYTVSIDERGFLGEGATENIGIVTRSGCFAVPSFARILRGITITRMIELARGLLNTGELRSIEEADITPEQAYEAAEIMVFGTSFDVLPVVDYDGHTIGDGRPGPIFHRFLALLREDIESGKGMLTPIGRQEGDRTLPGRLELSARKDLDESLAVRKAFSQAAAGILVQMAELVAKAFRGRHRLFLFGNGGSAADAQHIAAEFVNRFERERPPLPALALTVDTSVLTSIGNDYQFEEIFEKQLRGLAQTGDVALGISTSGRSRNVLKALRWARENGLHTLGWTGQSATDMDHYCDAVLHVPSQVTCRVQECHIAAGHLLCHLVDEMLFPETGEPS